MKLMTLAQVAELLNVKPKTIYDWTHRRRIPCVKLGRLLRFDQDEIERWVKSKKRDQVLN
jgi:excisionase family DNA binding protein